MAINISIIVPVYNVEKYLDTCIASLVNQNRSFHEIILVDDGSTDSSGEICERWKTKNEQIRLIHQENGGLSAARNAGLAAATGNYVLFVDSDDTIDLDTIERFEIIIGNAEPDLCVGNLRVVTGNVIKHRPHALSDSKRVINGSEYLKYEYAAHTMHMASVQCLYRRNFLIENNLWFTKGLLHEDELFTPVVFGTAQTVIPTEIEFYNHMIRDGSITTRKNKIKNAQSIVTICRLLEDWVKTIDDSILAEQILEHCVDLYYKVFVDADLVNWPEIRIENTFLVQYGKTNKNKMRYLLYRLNERAFTFAEKKRRRIKE